MCRRRTPLPHPLRRSLGVILVGLTIASFAYALHLIGRLRRRLLQHLGARLGVHRSRAVGVGPGLDASPLAVGAHVLDGARAPPGHGPAVGPRRLSRSSRNPTPACRGARSVRRAACLAQPGGCRGVRSRSWRSAPTRCICGIGRCTCSIWTSPRPPTRARDAWDQPCVLAIAFLLADVSTRLVERRFHALPALKRRSPALTAIVLFSLIGASVIGGGHRPGRFRDARATAGLSPEERPGAHVLNRRADTIRVPRP